MKKKPPSRPSLRAFTLAELMIVLLTSSMFLGFVYYFFLQNIQFFETHQRVSSMQNSLTFASWKLKSDLQKAGSMTLLSASDNRLCPLQNLNSAGIDAFTFTNNANPYTSADNRFKIFSDQLDVVGNLVNADSYLARITTGPTEIQFSSSHTELLSAAAFQRIFPPEQLISITGSNGKMQLAQIAGGNAYTTALALIASESRAVLPLISGHLNQSSLCGIGNGWFRVAPIQKVRYRINTIDWHLQKDTYKVSCTNAMVCTWTLMNSSDTYPPEIIAKNAVDLQFWFFFQDDGVLHHYDPTATTASQKAYVSDDGLPNFPSKIQDLRGMYFRISLRSPREEKTYNATSRTLGTEPLLGWDSTTSPGDARVRTILTHMMLPSFGQE